MRKSLSLRRLVFWVVNSIVLVVAVLLFFIALPTGSRHIAQILWATSGFFAFALLTGCLWIKRPSGAREQADGSAPDGTE
jgi:hypothetical protein